MLLGAENRHSAALGLLCLQTPHRPAALPQEPLMAQKKHQNSAPSQAVLDASHDILMAAPIGIFASTPQGKFLYANQALADMYGYTTPQELVASVQNIAAELFADPKDGPAVISLLGAEGIVKNYECEHIRKDGSRFWASGSIRTIFTEDGSVPHYQGFVTDITERKWSEEVLRLSETQFRNAFEYSAIGMALVSPEGRCLKVNSRFSAFFGYTEDELERKTFRDLTHPDDLDSDLKFVQRMLAGEIETYQMEKRYFHKNGSIVWGVLAVSLVWDDQGAPLHFISQIEDITDRKRAEEALRESLTRYDELVANVPVGVYIVWIRANGHLEFEYVSNRWCEIHQLKREDALADVMMANNQVHPDERNAFLVRNQESFRDRIPFSWEGRFFIGDGNLRWLRMESTPIVFDNGDIRWFGVTSDITDRKQVEEILAKQKQIMVQAEELAGLGSWEWDIKNDTWLLSENWKRIHGVPDIQLTTHQLIPIAHPEDRPAIEEAFAKAVEEAKDYDIEHRIVRQDTGEVRHVHAKGIVEVNNAGNPIAVVGAVQDITERKRADEIIRAINEQLQLANTEKDKLFSIIAHDLRSPMSGLVVSAQMLAEQPDIFSEKNFGFIATELHKNAQSTFELLEDLLQWARLSQGGINCEPTPCSLNELMNMGLSTAQGLANKKKISLRLEIAPDLTVLADQPMIKAVVRNILFNAIKFTPRGGEIVIRAWQEGRNVTLAIQDNGIGMDEQVLSSVFALGGKKQRRGTEGEKGTGLGLVLCKEFIEQHGGQIWVESEVGKGTTVFFTLPVSD
ncbi:MAG: PAS domain S-box protein [Desulfovibrionales bacterium]|nr:MAG: PAS domain S-box protein [Desulfovibrionales bacterium]